MFKNLKIRTKGSPLKYTEEEFKEKTRALQQAEQSLRLVVEGTSQVAGEDFFRSLVQSMTTVLSVRCAFVSECCENTNSRLRLLAIYNKNDFGETFEYDTKGTPCEHVIREGSAFYAENVSTLFPDDVWLQEEGIESYLAIALRDTEGKAIGHLGVVHDQQLPDNLPAKSILRIFAARAGAEIERQRALESLQKSEERFRVVFENANDALYLVDPETTKIVDCNQKAVEMVGYSIEEHKKMTVADLLPEEERNTFRETFRLSVAMRSRTGISDFHRQRKDGTLVPVEVNTSMVEIGGRKLLLGVVRDITERKRTEEKIRYQASLLKNVRDAIIAADLQGTITSWNEAAERMFGWKEEEIKGKFIGTTIATQEQQLLKTVMKQAKDKGEWRGEIIRLRKDATTFPTYTSVALLKNEQQQPLGFVGIVTDITERKHLDDIKSAFTSIVSHQLCTPLANIKWALEMLQEQDGKTKVFPQEVLSDARSAAQNMTDMMQTMLMLSRVEAGELRAKFSRTNIRSFLRKAVRQQKLACKQMQECEQKQQQLFLECAKEYMLDTDPRLLREILCILLCNAVKYTPKGGRITVKALQQGDRLHISVTDSGRGIPADQHKEVFTKFFRGDNIIQEDTEGTGLGLHLAHALVQLLGGEIFFVSKENKGTTFSLSFPIAQEKPPAPRITQAVSEIKDTVVGRH